jgi:hypothetical protein
LALLSISFLFGALLPFWLPQKTAPQPQVSIEVPQTATVPRNSPQRVEIAACRASDKIPDFFHDAAIILKQDMGEKKSRVFLAESEELDRYNALTWTIELSPEFSSYGLHIRSVHLKRISTPLDFYHPLSWQRQGERFPVDVPAPESKDSIFVLLAISGDQEIATDCKRLLKTSVGPPTQ